jgi:hypothetical protein
VQLLLGLEDWELYDIAHTVLPTRLPLDEFYREYAGLFLSRVRGFVAARARRALQAQGPDEVVDGSDGGARHRQAVAAA